MKNQHKKFIIVFFWYISIDIIISVVFKERVNFNDFVYEVGVLENNLGWLYGLVWCGVLIVLMTGLVKERNSVYLKWFCFLILLTSVFPFLSIYTGYNPELP